MRGAYVLIEDTLPSSSPISLLSPLVEPMSDPGEPRSLVKRGDTPIHAHDDFEVVLKPILTEYYMTPSEQRPYSWQRFAELLDEDFQLGLREMEDPGNYLVKWCSRYLASSWSLTPDMVRKRVAEAEADLVTAVEHEEQAEQLKEDIHDKKEPIIVDGELVDPGASLSEIAGARKKVAELKEKRDEELERWGVIPPKKAKDGASDVSIEAENFSLSQHFEEASGRDRVRELDADSEVH